MSRPDRDAARARVIERIRALPPGRRLIAVAGAPGSGKSTLAAALARKLRAPLVPMDGFHLDNGILDARGLRGVKGAPETFDADGFAALMARLRAGGEVIHHVFDRSRDLAVAGAAIVPADATTVLVEGNYLLLNDAPWSRLTWDLSVFLDVPEAELTRRLTARWRRLGCDKAGIAAHLANDLANARRVIHSSRPADLTLSN